MRSILRHLCLCLFAIALGPAALQAQDTWPTADVTDLWHKWHPKDEPPQQDVDAEPDPTELSFVVAPGIGARPSTGVTVGVSGNVAFYQGDQAATHLSTAIGGLRVSQKKQVFANGRFSLFTADDRWLVRGDNRINWMSLDTYGLGSNASVLGASNLKFTGALLQDTAYRGVAPGLFVGGGVDLSLHTNIRAADSEAIFNRSAYVAYTAQHGFAADRQLSTGTIVGILFDSRDNAINARHGRLASASYHTFFRGLGGDATFQQLSFDVRAFQSLTRSGSQRLAFWFMSDLITGGIAPYLDLPTIGGDIRSSRGYAEGRYRGERLVYGELEYRGSLTPSGLVGFVGFVNTATVASLETGTKLFDSYAPAVGFGFRVLLNKRSRTNLCVDWGFGKAGSHGFYLALQEAF